MPRFNKAMGRSWRLSWLGITITSLLTIAMASTVLTEEGNQTEEAGMTQPGRHDHAHNHGVVSETPSSPVDTPTVAGTPERDVPGLLPDLTTEVPEDVYIERHGDGRRLLRFETRVMNIGEGPMELTGELDGEGRAFATQHVLQEDGSADPYPAGELSHSDQHGHWHLNNFALFELRPDSGPGDDVEPLATQNKITFCLLDEVRIEDFDGEVADNPAYLDCDWRFQGISRGWSETYVASLPEQWVDITDVPDGRYTLHVTLNPDNLLIEADQDNNDVQLDVEIRGDEVERYDWSDAGWPAPDRGRLPPDR